MSNISVKSANQTLKAYNIGNDSSKNFSREGSFSDWSSNDQKFRDLVYSFVNNGWLMNESVHVMPIEKGFIYNDEIEKRNEHYMNLELKPFKVPTGENIPNDEGELVAEITSIELSNSEIIEAYKAVYIGAKPKYRQLDGYRRLLALPIANAIRVQMGKDPITEIPVVKFERELNVNEQLTLCVQENTLGNIGGQAISDIDRLCICRNMLKVGDFTGCSTEAKLKKLFGAGGLGRTMQQKLGLIIDLDNTFPMANLFKILRENPKSLKLINKEIMRPMIRNTKKSDDWEQATIEDVVEYFLKPEILNAPTKKQAVSGATMKAGGEKSKVEIFKELLSGGATGEIDDTLRKYDENAVLINTAVAVLMSGDTSHPIFIAVNDEYELQHAILMGAVTTETETETETTV